MRKPTARMIAIQEQRKKMNAARKTYLEITERISGLLDAYTGEVISACGQFLHEVGGWELHKCTGYMHSLVEMYGHEYEAIVIRHKLTEQGWFGGYPISINIYESVTQQLESLYKEMTAEDAGSLIPPEDYTPYL